MSVRTIRLFRGALLASLVAFSFAQDDDGEVPEPPPEQLVPVLDGPHCVGNEFNLPGQGFHLSGSGFHLSGSTGGMVLGDIVYEDPTGLHAATALTPVTVTQVMNATGNVANLSVFGQVPQHDVLIVVADDFEGDQFSLPTELFTLSPSENRPSDLENLVTSGPIPHGVLVLHHLNSLIAATEAFDLAKEPAKGAWYWQHSGTGAHVIVQGLHIPKSYVEDGRLPLSSAQDVMNTLREHAGPEIDRLLHEFPDLGGVVVNMSWVLLPCETINDFLTNIDNYKSFEDYFNDLGIDPALYNPDDVVRHLFELDEPGLEGFLAGDVYGQLEHEAFVAAAGNFAMPYQMLPANWSDVVGVAVAPPDPPRPFPGRYSNVGDDNAPGEWIALQEILQNGDLAPQPSALSYAGTSYAAPLVSLYLALDMVDEQKCLHVKPGVPPLAKASDPDPADMPLLDAIDNCKPVPQGAE